MTDFTIQARLAEDRALLSRVAACVAGSGHPNPLGWAYEHAWALAVQPGWCCAVHDGDGTSEGITDQMIADAVNAILAAEPPPNPDTITSVSPAE